MNDERELPTGVLERLQGYAERAQKKIGEAANGYLAWIKQEFAVSDWKEEDDDLLVEWAEMFTLETRNLGSTGGGSRSSVTFVGHFVGLDDNINDLRTKMREKAISAYRNNSSQAIDNGVIGIIKAKDGVWCVNGEPTKERIDGDKLPWFALNCDGDTICLLNEKGTPMAPESKVRNLYLLGNAKDDFNSEIKIWRISLTGTNMTEEYELGRPVTCQAILPNKDKYDTVYTNRDFSKTMVYTDSFVDDDDRNMLRPEKFLINTAMHNQYVELDELSEAYDERKIMANSGNYYGPLVLTKGYVSRLNLEPMQSDYDQTGRSFRLSVTSGPLQRKYGKDSAMSEVTVWVPGRIYDDGHPFEFKDSYGEWQPYAEKTPVIIFGRVRMSVYNDQTTPNLTAFGFYVPPRTARPGAKGGDTSIDQFKNNSGGEN